MSAQIIYKISANLVVYHALISKTTTNGKFPQWKFRRSSTSNVEPISRLRFQLTKKQILHLPTPGQRAHLPQQTAGRLLCRWSLAWSCSTPSTACPFPLRQALSASPPPPSRGPAAASASPDGNTAEGRAEQAVRMSLVRQGRYPHRGQGVRAGPPVRAARRRCAVGLPHQLRRMWTFGRGIGGLGGEGACELAAGRGGLGGERSDGRA